MYCDCQYDSSQKTQESALFHITRVLVIRIREEHSSIFVEDFYRSKSQATLDKKLGRLFRRILIILDLDPMFLQEMLISSKSSSEVLLAELSPASTGNGWGTWDTFCACLDAIRTRLLPVAFYFSLLTQNT